MILLAAVGGAALFIGFHLNDRAMSIPFVLGHGITAIIGYLLLLFAIFRCGL